MGSEDMEILDVLQEKIYTALESGAVYDCYLYCAQLTVHAKRMRDNGDFTYKEYLAVLDTCIDAYAVLSGTPDGK